MSKKWVTPPKAWKAWKPFKDRGLGLGKFVGGIYQAMGEDVEMRGGRLQSLGDFADTNPLLGGDPNLIDKEKRWDAIESIDDPSNEQLLELFTGSGEDISRALKSLGIEDINQDLAGMIFKNKSQFFKLLKGKLKKGMLNIEGSYKDITENLLNKRRSATSFGNSDDLYESFAKLDAQYGGTKRQATADVLNEIMSTIEEGQT
tara:strand:- start:1073 stop:1681 length:609 start_codon:yes stop_codon:yes gene_type:complete